MQTNRSATHMSSSLKIALCSLMLLLQILGRKEGDTSNCVHLPKTLVV